jgi:hypothetical protein
LVRWWCFILTVSLTFTILRAARPLRTTTLMRLLRHCSSSPGICAPAVLLDLDLCPPRTLM